MHLRHVLSHKENPGSVIGIAPDRPVRELAERMSEHGIGAVLVFGEDDPDDVVGIVTERDILRNCCRLHETMDQLLVKDVMEQDVVFGSPDDLVADALRVMSKRSIRYLPLRENGKVIGLVSVGDVLRALYDEDEIHLRHLGEYLAGTYRSDVY